MKELSLNLMSSPTPIPETKKADKEWKTGILVNSGAINCRSFESLTKVNENDFKHILQNFTLILEEME